MIRPIIGIIARCELSETKMNLNVVHEAERIAILKSGGIPILVLPPQRVEYNNEVPRKMKRLTDEEKMILRTQIDKCDGILMPGGDKMYEYDRYVTEYVLQSQKPLLGICMGMQLMCTYNKKIVLEMNDSKVEHFSQKKKAHMVYIKEQSKLYQICKKDNFVVNSRHRRHVIDANDFCVVARSEDGVIEAIEGAGDIFQLGVQWHPELDYEQSEESRQIFRAFINSML